MKFKFNIQSQINEIKDLKIHISDLNKQNVKYENTVKKLMSIGKKPKNYKMPEIVSRGSYERFQDKMKYAGDFTYTYYCPDIEECGKSDGISFSGIPVTPAYTIAADLKYWEIGTKFYSPDLGIVLEIQDIGGDIKGKYRIDICTFSKELAKSGSHKMKLYFIEE